MLTRRQFIQRGAAGGAALTLAGRGGLALAAPRAFAPYKVALPIPPKAVAGADGSYSISAEDFTQALHPKLGTVNVWGYSDGVTTLYPGPTIEVHKDDPTTVHYTNNLATTHFLPVVPGVAGSRGTNTRILTHLHGGHVSGDDDGNPHAAHDEYASGATQTATYPPQPRATTLWYHDHALGMTRLNVYAGLAGYFLVRDEDDTGAEPNPIGIPGSAFEIPIVIQDKSFRNGQLFYSPGAPGADPGNVWIPEFFGDTVVVNGAVQPFLTVEPRKYRFRFLNGSQSRFYNLDIAGGPVFHQIGSEGGMFDAPVSTNRIQLLPAERADVIVDFSGLAGEDLVLQNDPLPAGVVSPATPKLSSLMQFRVRGPVSNPDTPAIPASLPGSKPSFPGPPAQTRYITLEEVLDPDGNPVRLEINGRVFDDPVDEEPVVDTIEDWSFVNISADTHPIHMHLTSSR